MKALNWSGPAGLVALLILAAPAAAQDDNPEVTRLNLHGVESVDKDELRASIATEESRCRSWLLQPVCWISKSRFFFERNYLDPQELPRDVLRIRVFYWKRGFRATQVDTAVVPRGRNGVEVTFDVAEGPPTIVTSIEVTQTNEVLSERDIARAVVLREAAPLNLLRLDSTRVRLEQSLWERGYADAIVDTNVVLGRDELTASVVIALDPRWVTTIDTIHVHGNEKVTERTIRRSLLFAEKDIFRLSDLLRSQRNLYESNLFRRVVIEQASHEILGDSAKVVDINVVEAPLREARLSLGFNTVDFVQTEARYTHYNFTGGARRLTAQLSVGNLFAGTLNNRFIFADAFTVPTSERARYLAPTYNASVELRQPWFGSGRNDLATSAFTHRRSAPGIYVDRGYGGSATFTRLLTDRAPASLNYRYEETSVDAGDVYFCVNFGVCDIPTLDALRDFQRMSPLALTGSIDRTNDPLGPSRGVRVSLDAEHASGLTASDYRYNRATAEAAGFMRIRRRGVLGGRIRAGWVDALPSSGRIFTGDRSREVLHPRKRFYAGGAQSVRGFGENQLGPRVLTISNDRLRGAAVVNGADTTLACPPAIPIEQCDPNVAPFSDRDFQPRPLGGNRVYEASIELRFPIWEDRLTGAAFIDAGYVAQRIHEDLPGSRFAATPGIGVRYQSPVGPIRVDVGFNPARREDLPVVTETFVDGERRLTRLETRRAYQSARSGFAGILDRMRLHLSIGEAF